MTTKISKIEVVGIMFVGALIFAAMLNFRSQPAIGSVTEGQGYTSTTTASTVASTWTEARTVTGTSTRSGIFGSVVITKQTQATTLNIYDATTTDITLRNNVATSSILLASFGTSTPVGTYVFDSNFKTGLIVDPTPIGGGMVASSTITWK